MNPAKSKPGFRDEHGDIEIVQGLLEGEHVVTSAQFMLDSESKLREAIQKMLEPKAPLVEQPAPADMKKAMSPDDLFADDGKKKKGQDDLEGLFDDKKSKK